MDWDDLTVRVRRGVRWASALFLPWYLWSLAYYPEPLLWWLASAAGIVCVIAAIRWPRSVLYWLVPGIMLFNHVHFWLPWPHVKLAYICPAAVCCAMALRPHRARDNEPLRINLWFGIWLLCMASAACMGVLRHWCAQEPAARHELAWHLRLLPFVNEWSLYIPLRYVWMWSLALSTYLAVLPLLRRARDVRILMWSMVASSFPIALFGIYSYVTRSYMVSHYVMERRISATFSSPAVLADMLTVACVVCGFFLYTERRRALRVLAACALALNALAVLYSGCRINMLALAAGAVLALLAMAGLRWSSVWRRRWLILAAAAGVAGVAAAAWCAAPERLRAHVRTMPAIARTQIMLQHWRAADRSLVQRVRAVLPGRISHWEAAARMLWHHPLWGIGAGLFERSYERFRARDDLFVFARAHNVPLRIAAECGLVTLLACAAAIISAVATLYSCRGSGRACDAHWLVVRRTLCVIGLMLFATSFFSDIWLENTESVMMLSVLMAVGTVTCRVLAPGVPEPDDPVWPEYTSWWQRTEAALHERVMLLTWGWLDIVHMRRALVWLAVAAMCLLGLRRAFYEGRKTMLRGSAMHGFTPASSLLNLPGEWFAFGRSAMRSVIVPSAVMRVTIQPLNERMARESPRVSVYINDVVAGELTLYPGAPGTLYCDVSALHNDAAVIRFVAQRTFCPWQLGWFKDPFAYGGICSALQWLHQDPLMAFTSLDGLWNAHWTARAHTYFALGHTNLDATVRVPFFVHSPP